MLYWFRFSDFTTNTTRKHKQRQYNAFIRTQKTSERVAIPLHKTVRTILKKYNNKLPKAYTNQVTNVYLKESQV
jgi:hypothetical protein